MCYTVDTRTQTSDLIEVPLERQKVQSLIDDEITELAWMGKRIEKHYGRPMDIEWAIDKDLPAGGNIFILQARPETVWSARSRSAQSHGGRLGHGLHPVGHADRQEGRVNRAIDPTHPSPTVQPNPTQPT